MGQAPGETATLFERVGGTEGLSAIISDIVDAHLANPAIRTRFEAFDPNELKRGAFEFFAMAMGGPVTYTGRGLRETHKGMNINEQEFVAATDDLMAVLQKRGVPEREQNELLAAFFAMKGDVLHL